MTTRTLSADDVRGFYAALGVELPGWAHTNAHVRCFIDPDAHERSDRDPSMSVSLESGAYCCHGCGAAGGAYDAALNQGHTERSAIELMITHHLTDRRPGPAAHPRRPPRTQAPRPRPASQPTRRLAASESQIIEYHRRLLTRADVLERLQRTRGWTRAAICELTLGLDDEGQVTIPVRDHTGRLAALLRYRPGQRMRATAGSRRVLYPHPAAVSARLVLLVEGEPDRIAARSHQLPAVAIPGVNGWQPEWAALFDGREIVIVMDCDPQGRAAAPRIAGDLQARGIATWTVDLDPTRRDGYDLTDWLHDHPDRQHTLLTPPPPQASR